MIIAENTTHFVGVSEMFDYGKSFKTRWAELMNYVASEDTSEKKEDPKEDNRPATEIAKDIWKRMKKRK